MCIRRSCDLEKDIKGLKRGERFEAENLIFQNFLETQKGT